LGCTRKGPEGPAGSWQIKRQRAKGKMTVEKSKRFEERGARGAKRAKWGAGGGLGVVLGWLEPSDFGCLFWLTGGGTLGNLKIDCATVSRRTEIVSRPRGPRCKASVTGLVGILMGVFVGSSGR